jgi:hypothetical protein
MSQAWLARAGPAVDKCKPSHIPGCTRVELTPQWAWQVHSGVLATRAWAVLSRPGWSQTWDKVAVSPKHGSSCCTAQLCTCKVTCVPVPLRDLTFPFFLICCIGV